MIPATPASNGIAGAGAVPVPAICPTALFYRRLTTLFMGLFVAHLVLDWALLAWSISK